MAESSPSGKKTLWEKEKLQRLVLQTRNNKDLFGKGLRPWVYGSGLLQDTYSISLVKGKPMISVLLPSHD